MYDVIWVINVLGRSRNGDVNMSMKDGSVLQLFWERLCADNGLGIEMYRN